MCETRGIWTQSRLFHIFLIYRRCKKTKFKQKKKQGHLKYLNELYKMLELNNLPYMKNLMRSKTLLNK